MNLDKLKKEAEQYKSVLQEIAEHRQFWKESTKKCIVEALQAITKEVKLPWKVFQSKGYVNHEAVGLVFQTMPSGVVKKEVHSVHNYIKFGASLAFSQSYNGEINVILNYPHVEKWTEKLAPEKLATISPEKIDEVFVVKQVETFLDKVADWELKSVDNKIGFDF